VHQLGVKTRKSDDLKPPPELREQVKGAAEVDDIGGSPRSRAGPTKFREVLPREGQQLALQFISGF
jgi:hypothetical protein